MTRRWNGKALIDELGERLWDTSTGFREKIIGWANEIQDDIVSELPLEEYDFKLKKLLPTDQEIISLSPEVPAAPTLNLTQTSSTLNYNTTTSGDYTSSSLTEFNSTSVTLAEDTTGPADETMYASFATNADGVRGDGTLTGTITNGSVTGGEAVLNAGGDITWTATSKINHRRGTIRGKYTTNWTGNPSAIQSFVDFAESDGANRDRMAISQQTNGQIRAFYWNTAGTLVGFNDFGAWSPTAGTTYELEFSWDFTPGSEAIRIFVDGTQLGSTDTTAVTTADDITAVGHLQVGDSSADFNLDDLQIFSTVQHTANFTSEVPRVIPVYTATDQTVNLTTGVTIGELAGFTAVTNEPTNTSVVFHLDVDGVLKWWNGSAWATSDGTSSQSNTAADINTNAEALIDASSTIKINAILTNSSESDRPSLTSVTYTDKGDLVTGTEYIICCSFLTYDEDMRNYVESEVHNASNPVTADLDNQTISVSNIPLMGGDATYAPTNVYRRVYMSAKATGETSHSEPFFVQDITDNTTTTLTISAATTSTRTPVSDTEVDKVSSKHMFFPASNKYLAQVSNNAIRRYDPDSSNSTTPDYFDYLGNDRITLYPKLSTSATDAQRTLVYFVKRRPHEIFYDTSMLIDMPISLKKVLIQGVVFKGYQYRDRDGWVGQQNLYEEYKRQAKVKLLNQRGRPSTVRDVNRDVDGFEV